MSLYNVVSTQLPALGLALNPLVIDLGEVQL